VIWLTKRQSITKSAGRMQAAVGEVDWWVGSGFLSLGIGESTKETRPFGFLPSAPSDAVGSPATDL
jgi:hypothetical protein